MAEKLRLMERLRLALAGRPDVQALFVGATSLDNVLSLLASLYLTGKAGGQAGELETVLMCGIEHCHQRLESDQALTQPELLVVSVAEQVAVETGELAAACAAVRSKQRHRRREGMNMGRLDKF